MKLARVMRSIRHLRNDAKTVSSPKETKMFSNVSSNISAAVAAIFSAAIFVGASVGPAVSNAASVVA